MRIGLVGLSSPVFYDYRHPASIAQSDLSSSPNPVLEGAFGALLLYDELWFLCRSLCPENMRSISCVKFLDELGMLPEFNPDSLPEPGEMFDAASLNAFGESFSAWDEVKKSVGVNWDAAIDNHTHGIQVGLAHLNGNSVNPKNIVYDLLLAERLHPRVELIGNSFSSRLCKTEALVRDRLKLAEVLVLNSVPQFLTPSGPYHPCIEEVRESSYLKYFRRWIVEEVNTAGSKEVGEVKAEVEAKLSEAMEKVFLKHLKPSAGYSSLAETILGVGADALLPGAGAVVDLMGQLSEERQKEGVRWQGFIVESRAKLRGV